ncbi:MAG: NAD(P)H-binding protein, partial [Bacteroidia bacterium]|nr:NAD(P)H-binding protein [Bacteroidia bacterium]
MKAIIAGSTGEVGKNVLLQLLDKDLFHEVTSLTRRKSLIEHGKLNNQHIDFDAIEKLAPINADALFCCLGTTIKKAGSKEQFRKVDFKYVVDLASWAKKAGVQQFHVVSAMGANSKSGVFYNRTKGEMEEALIQFKFDSTYIYRPSLLDSDRDEKRIGERIGILVFRMLKFLFVGPLKKYASIKVEDVAKGMV